MGLLKLINNRISSEWKDIFNKNVDYMNDLETKLTDTTKVTNNRIDNLVLSSGGDSSNEVVDARVNNKGDKFNTLQNRLTTHENLSDEQITKIITKYNEQKSQLEQLNNAVKNLIGGYNEPINIYISKTGNDVTGDGSQEKPFQTIQTGINTIPTITNAPINIFIDNGTYLEDLNFDGLTFNGIYITPLNNVTNLDPNKTDCPVKIRSLRAGSASGYMSITGVQFVDTANAPKMNEYQYAIANFQSVYMAVVQCKFSENTKARNYCSIISSGTSKIHVYNGTTFINQKYCFFARMMGEINVSDIQGSGNDTALFVDSGTIRCAKQASGFTTTENNIVGRGIIINSGKVL